MIGYSLINVSLLLGGFRGGRGGGGFRGGRGGGGFRGECGKQNL